MSYLNKIRTVFIREGTPLPVTLAIQSEAFLPGWRAVTNVDRQALTRRVESAHWRFFYLAGEIRATVFGRERPGAVRRAVKRVLAKQPSPMFNSLEITRIVGKRFLGFPFLSIAANFRHIQQGIALLPVKDFVLKLPAAPVSTLGAATETKALAAAG